MTMELQADVDVGIERLLVGELDVASNRGRAHVVRAAVGGLHDARPAAGHDGESGAAQAPAHFAGHLVIPVVLLEAGRAEDGDARPHEVQAAAGPQASQPVVVAYTLGRGLVIRSGLSQWSARLGRDANVDAVTRRAWTLLSR